MTLDQDINPNEATRTIFNGLNADIMFVPEKVLLPELAPGEILVKVINILFD